MVEMTYFHRFFRTIDGVLVKVFVPTFYRFLMNFSIDQVLACYNERLSTSKEEEEEDFGEEEKIKPTKKVSFEF